MEEVVGSIPTRSTKVPHTINRDPLRNALFGFGANFERKRTFFEPFS